MPRDTRNIGASVRARLLQRSRAENSDYQILLTRYALERLLYRLSLSAHRDRFILKGALLFVTWIADPFRPTRDLDLLGYGDSSPEALALTFRDICSTSVLDDGVHFDTERLTASPIREDLEYGGVRIQTSATIDGARIPIQVDIGFGDIITRNSHRPSAPRAYSLRCWCGLSPRTVSRSSLEHGVTAPRRWPKSRPFPFASSISPMPGASRCQLVENLSAPEVHPMEEAQGFRALLDLEEPKYSIEQIAAKVGKSSRLRGFEV